MKNNSSQPVAFALIALGMLAAMTVSAANWAWSTNPAAANFSGANWTSGTAAGTAAGTPASADSLYFGFSSITNLNNDDSGFTFTNLTFNAGASAFNLTNNAISLGGDILDLSTSPETINFSITLLTSRNVNVTNGGSALLGGTVSGSALGITKLGAGTLTLTNLNGYTGGTVINAGNLTEDFSSLATVSNIIASASALTLGGGTLTIKGKSGATTSQTNASAAFSANTASALVVNQNGATAVNMLLNGLTRNGGGTLDVTPPTGGTIKTTTTTTTGNNKINGNGIAYSTANGGTTWLTNSAVSPATLGAMAAGSYSADTFAASADTDITASDVPAAFTNNTVRFNVASKTLTLNSSAVSQVAAGGILVTPNGAGSVIASGGGNAALQAGATGKEIVIHDYATLTLSAPITNNAGGASVLTIGGTGTTTLSGANQHTGGTLINNGITKAGLSTAGATGPFGATNMTLTVGLAGTLDLNGFNVGIGTFNAAAGSLVTNSGATINTFTIGNGNNRISGMTGGTTFGGNVKLVIVGNNGTRDDFSVANSVPNSHTGGTTWLGNNLTDRVVNPAVFGYGPVTFGGSGGFTIPSSGLTGWNNNFTNAVIVNGTGNVWNFQNNSSGNLIFSTGAWTGSGTLTLNNSFTPTFNWAGDISAFAGAFTLQGGGETFSISYVNTNNGNLAGSALATFDLQSSGTGTENLQYAGSVTNPIILLGDLNTTGNTGSGALTLRSTLATAAATFVIGGLNASSTFSGNIINNAGTVGITKVGAGVWNLTGTTLSYTGPTTVSNGVLLANGNLTGGGAVTVYGPGGLGGSGTISGAVTFTNNAVYTNGTGTTLSCAGGLTLNSGNILNFGLGTASDSIALTGGVYANNATTTPLTVNIQNLTGFGPNTYSLITGASIANTNNFILGSVPSGYAGVLVSDGSSLQVTISLSALSTAWWRGSANGNWNNSGTFNWNTDQASGVNAGGFPSQPTDVHFSANGAANLNTTLGAGFTINTLTFDTAQSASIGGANALTVNSGITNSSAAGNNVISNAGVVLGLDQTWANNSANALTVSAAVSGGHALTTIGNLVLSGNNSYGATTIASGTLQIGAGGGSGSLGAGNVTNNGSLLINRSGSLAVSGMITGLGSLTNAGSGTTILNSAATYTGNTLINAGALQLGAANAVPNTGVVTINGTLDLNTFNEILGQFSGNGNVDSTTGGTPTLTVGTNDTSSSFSGQIKNTSGTLALTKIGAGTVTLAGADSFSGPTAVNVGDLQFNGAAAMSSASALAWANGTTMALHSDTSAIFSPASLGQFNTNPGGSGTADATTFTIDVNNVTAGSGRTMTLNGALTFAPTTQGNYGADQLTVYITGGNGYTLALGAVTSQNNGTGGGLDNFDVASGMGLSMTNFTFAPGYTGGVQFQDSGSVTVGDIVQPSNRSLLINLNGPTVTINGNAQHTANNNPATDNFNLMAGQLNINSAKALRGDNAGNTFTSILTITGGNLDNTSGNAVTMANPITQNWNADFTFIGSSNLDMNSGSVTLGSSRTVTINASTLSVDGPVGDSGGGYSLTKNGNGTLLLAGSTNSFTGGVFVDGGTFGLGTAQGGTGSITTSDGTLLQVTVLGTNQLSPSSYSLGGGGSVTNTFVGVSSTTFAPVNAGSLTVNGALMINVTSGNFVAGQSYPLIAYGGETVSGSVSLGSLPIGINATLTDNGIGLIYLTVSSVSPEIWTGAVNGAWTIGGPNNWTFASLTTNYFDGSTVRFDDTASGATAITNIGAVSPSSTTVSNSVKLYSLSGGAIGGSGSLTKDGAGTLILASTNTYSGATIILNGALQLGDGAFNMGSVAGSITDGANLIFNVSADQSIGNAIGGGGMVTKTNANTLTLTASSSFNGGLVVKAGRVVTTVANNGFGDPTNMITLGDASNGADVIVEVGGSWISDGQPVTVVGSGSRMLRGTWSNGGQVQFWGNVTLSSADVRFQQTGASPARYAPTTGITGTGNVIATNTSSGPTDFRALINNTGFIRNDSTGTGGISEGNPAVSAGGSFGANVSSLIQNSTTSGFNISAPNNSFLGNAQVLVGTMFATYAGALNSNNVVSVASGATFDIQNLDLPIAGLNNVSGSGGTVTDSTGASLHTLTLGGGGNYSFGGSITAATAANRALTVNLQPGGVQTLSGASTYTGNTTINGGTLALTGAASLASVNYSIAGGATFDVSGLSSTFALGSGQTLTGSSGTGIIAGNFNLNSGSALVLNYTNGTPVLNVMNGTLALSSGDSMTVTVSGTQLPAGNYKLISKGTGGAVGGAVPASVTVNGAGATAGASLQITGGELFLVVGSTPATITTTLSGNQLSLSWPSGAGWYLQAQTNPVATGLGTSWVTTPTAVDGNYTVTINPAKGAVFYRLSNTP